MGEINFHNNIFKLIFISFFLFQTINCTPEKSLWEKSWQADTVEVYQSYLDKYPNGTHQDDALIRMHVLRKRAFADNIFLNIKNIYQTNWDLLKKPSVIVLTLSNENEYFLNQQKWDYVWLEFNLRKIYAYKKNKAIFFWIFSKSTDYQKIIELLNMLKDVGIEEIIPVITPELEKILCDRFHSRIDLEEVKSIMKRSLPIVIPGGVELEPDDPDIFMSVPGDENNFETTDLSKPIVLPKWKKLKLLKTGKIEYPELFPELAGLKNEILIVRIETDIYGRANNVKILKCHPSLWEMREVIIHAIKKWVYDYFVSNGLPKKVVFIEEIKFSTLY